MPPRSSLEFAFSAAEPQPVARSPKNWSGFSAEFVEIASSEPYAFKSRGESHYLALHDIALRDGELRIDGLPTLRNRDLRDTITFVPKGCGIEGWSQPHARGNSFVAMYFDPEAIREDLGHRYARHCPQPFAYARNAQLRATLKKLEALVQAPEVDDLHAESVCLLASLEIFGVLADPQGRLSDRQLGAVYRFVDAHLSEPISLADLAAVAGLSRFHFSRSFKAATGENPHIFVQRRRIARAMDLLRLSDLPVDAISLTVGFKGASQFRRVFRVMVGTSPLEFRRQRR